MEVSVEVGEYLDRADHKTENLFHKQRRYWDGREYDEYIIAHECSRSYYETPKNLLCRKETLQEITVAFESCTAKQRYRFPLFTLEGLRCYQSGNIYSCSKSAILRSMEAVRKKVKCALQTE